MENKDRIYENLILTMLAAKLKTGGLRFYLVGLVPAEIIWEGGQRERIELAGRIVVEPFSEGKELIGNRVARKEFMNKIKSEYVTQLVEEVLNGFQKAQETKTLGGKTFTFLALV